VRRRPYAQYRDTPLWAAVANVLAELQASGEVRVDTAPEYVIDYLCRELAAKSVIAPAAPAPAP
jgi:hypothetical protein